MLSKEVKRRIYTNKMKRDYHRRMRKKYGHNRNDWGGSFGNPKVTVISTEATEHGTVTRYSVE